MFGEKKGQFTDIMNVVRYSNCVKPISCMHQMSFLFADIKLK